MPFGGLLLCLELPTDCTSRSKETGRHHAERSGFRDWAGSSAGSAGEVERSFPPADAGTADVEVRNTGVDERIHAAERSQQICWACGYVCEGKGNLRASRRRTEERDIHAYIGNAQHFDPRNVSEGSIE